MRRATKTAFCPNEQRTRLLLWLSHAVNFCFVRNSLRRILDVGFKKVCFFLFCCCCFEQETSSIGIQNHQQCGRRHHYASTASRKFLQCLSISWTWARFSGKTFINHLTLKQNKKTHTTAPSSLTTATKNGTTIFVFVIRERKRNRWIGWFISIFLWPLLCIAKHSIAAINFLIFSSKKVIWLMRWMGSMTLQPKHVCAVLFIRSFHSCCARCCTYKREW